MNEPTYRFTRAQIRAVLTNAIELYLEFRDTHGQDDRPARLYGVGEVLDGLDADRYLAGDDPAERLRLQLVDAQDELLAACLAAGVADEGPCYYDHHGSCQAHKLQPKGQCYVELGRAAIAKASPLPLDATPEQLRQVRDGVLVWRGNHWEMPPGP